MANTWILVASKPAYSTIGTLISWSTLPWLLLMYTALPTGIVPGAPFVVRIVSVPLLFAPITVWLLAQVFSDSRWMSWFYRTPSRVRLDDNGITWQLGDDPPTGIGPWPLIAGLKTQQMAATLVDESDRALARLPGDVAWVRDPETNRLYTFAAAMMTFRPRQYGVAYMFGAWPGRLRPREQSDTEPDVPVKVAATRSGRQQAVVLVAIAVASAALAWFRST